METYNTSSISQKQIFANMFNLDSVSFNPKNTSSGNRGKYIVYHPPPTKIYSTYKHNVYTELIFIYICLVYLHIHNDFFNASACMWYKFLLVSFGFCFFKQKPKTKTKHMKRCSFLQRCSFVTLYVLQRCLFITLSV